MPHVILATQEIANQRRELFVVDQAVGPGCPNVAADVRLVQSFLKVATLTANGVAGFQPPGQQAISVDGVFGPQTQAYISFFQADVNRRKNRQALATDGRIDPIRPGQLVGSISHTFYTILELNVTYRTRRGDTSRLETDPFFPIELKPFFFL